MRRAGPEEPGQSGNDFELCGVMRTHHSAFAMVSAIRSFGIQVLDESLAELLGHEGGRFGELARLGVTMESQVAGLSKK